MKDKKNKIITVRSGVDPAIPEFKNYYQRIKTQCIKTVLLDIAVNSNSEVLVNPLVFNADNYLSYNIDDISFFWYEGKIIGHQVINITKTKLGVYKGPTPSGQNQFCFKTGYCSLEYYCEQDIEIDNYKYYQARINGKLESKIKIAYEKQKTIQKKSS